MSNVCLLSTGASTENVLRYMMAGSLYWLIKLTKSKLVDTM